MFLVEVEYDYEAELQDELTIHAGDILTSVKQMSGGWWEGVLKGKRGLFPENFVKVRNRKFLKWLRFGTKILFPCTAINQLRKLNVLTGVKVN